MKKKKQKNKEDDLMYFPIPAGILIGLGLGLLIGEVASFVIIGLGIGFLVTWLVERKK